MRIKSIFIMIFMVVFAFNVSAIAANAPEKAKEQLLEINLTTKASEKDAAYSKKIALNDGRKQAFYAALLQLAPKQARDVYRKVRGEDLNNYLHSYTIKRQVEKAGYYEADVTFRFFQEKLLHIIGIDRGIAPDEANPTGDGLLVIPLYDIDEKLLLFDEGNEWRYILNNVALEVGQGRLVMPFGDVRDQSLLKAQQVIAGNKDAISTLARKYGARNVVIAAAKARLVGGMPIVQVSLQRIGAKKDDIIIKTYKAKNETETIYDVMTVAADEAIVYLNKSIDDYSLFGENEANKVRAIVLKAEYLSGKQWRYMLEAMRTLPDIIRIDLGAVGLNSAQATILYKGDANVIRLLMQERDLQVDDSQEYWIVRTKNHIR